MSPNVKLLNKAVPRIWLFAVKNKDAILITVTKLVTQ